MSRRETCAKCRYWDPDEFVMGQEPEGGECRRRSPRWHPVAIFPRDTALWPVTAPGDWCGEYDYKMGQATERARMDIAFPGLTGTGSVGPDPRLKDAVLMNHGDSN